MKWFLAALLLTIPACERTVQMSGAATGQAMPHGIEARVVGITDGDSLTVMIDGQPVKVRIEGIDAPEKGQPHGTSAKTALSVLTAGRTVHIAATGKDRYGRTLARVSAGSADVGLEMIRQGQAWHFLRYNKNADLAEAEVEARESGRGLWADAEPVAPWAWRKAKRTPEATTTPPVPEN